MTFLSHYPNIQALDLSQNCLTSLSIQHRLAFSNIATLNFSHNLITAIHPFLFSNTSFEFVDLSHNRLIRFWAADYEINQLLLNHNRITQIDIDSAHRKEMKALDAGNNRLKIIQLNVDFESLILTNNQLELDEYFSIRNVYGTLDLSGNHISEFEFDRKIISCVTNLNLSYNRLTTVSARCTKKRYQRVEQLNLDGNLLCSFDQSIDVVTTCLPNLKFISLLHNRMNRKMQIATKTNLTQHNIKSQVFDHEAQLFSQYTDDDYRMSIFRN
jgi:Leucine-rich repeat (LRR) protein